MTREGGRGRRREEYELDCLIYATGFEVGTEYARRAGYETRRDAMASRSVREVEGRRHEHCHGLHIHGFPNCFMMSIAQSGLTVNFPYMINEQAKHIAYVIQQALGRAASGRSKLEVTERPKPSGSTRPGDAVCARTSRVRRAALPGYYNNEGQAVGRQTRQNFFHFGGPTEFVELSSKPGGPTTRWRGWRLPSSQNAGGRSTPHHPTFDHPILRHSTDIRPRRPRNWPRATSTPAATSGGR